MKKTLFRLTDILELCIAYAFCFSLNLAFDYVKTLQITSDLLASFLRNFLPYQSIIVILSTFVVIVFHYQFSCRKKQKCFAECLLVIHYLTLWFDIHWSV